MYQVVDKNYPRLDTYLCYECGFHADTILIEQRGLYQAFQRLFHNSQNQELLKLKNYQLSDEKLQGDNKHKTNDKVTEPYKWFCNVFVGLVKYIFRRLKTC